MTGRARLAVAASMLLGALCLGRDASAHDFYPGVLTLVAEDATRYRVSWTAPVDSGGLPAEIEVTLPDGCDWDRARGVADCGDGGLAGEIAFSGLESTRTEVIVVVDRGGSRREWIAHAGAPSVDVGAAARSGFGVWLALGARHIVLGPDHLAFVVGLVLVLGGALDRRLLVTLSAFTVAHSITLALSALGLLRLASGPVEATIAASVVLVAREALRDRKTAIRRWPWAVAGIFGLVHGLGFAGALAGLGLPEGARLASLAAFNLGVEVGQVAVVVAAAALARAASQLRVPAGPGRVVACHALGAAGAYWLIARVADLLRITA